MRPRLLASRLQDDPQKVMFVDGKWVQVPGGRASVLAEERVIYLAMSVDGDADGGQRVVTRLGLQPRQDESWLVSVNRHWNIDRPDPR